MKKTYKETVQAVEKKWVTIWKKTNPAFCDLDTNKKKFYSLGMFVYPSGEGLHAGHPKNYFPLDAISRYKKMQGFEVLNPMGFDSFGLPAEQHARKTGEDPKKTIESCIKNFKNQFNRLGMFYDWTKEVKTSDPKYFKITQWCFIRLFKTGFANRTKESVNWCPKLGTVLANEETKLDNGKLVSDVGSFPVVKREEVQWTMNMKLDADELLSNLHNKELMDWPKEVIKEQVNWIGEVKLKSVNIGLNKIGWLKVNIVREDITKGNNFTLFITKKHLNTDLKIKKTSFNVKNKEGIDTQVEVGLINDKANAGNVLIYVLDSKFVVGDTKSLLLENNFDKEILDLLIGGRDFDHLYPSFQKYAEDGLKSHDSCIYRLRNWIFSRQRYWGEPIPMYYDKNNNELPANISELPIIQPKVSSYIPEKNKLTVLETQTKWINVKKKDEILRRESFTMPQWAGSSWYHLAYLLKEGNKYLDITSEKAKKRFKKWLPVNLYIGGKEHTVLHLIYARFWHHILSNNYGNEKILQSITKHKEPFYKLLNQGMVQDSFGKKMSKSKGNGINPLELVDKFGADSYRLYLLFAAPINDPIKLDLKGIESMHSWLGRVWRLSENIISPKKNAQIDSDYNLLIKKATQAIEDLKLNVTISFMMEFVNSCYKNNDGKISEKHLIGLLKVLHCFAPFISQEIFSRHKEGCITDHSWPKANEEKIIKKNATYPIQINGKTRAVLEITSELSDEEIIEAAISCPKIEHHLKGKKIIKKFFIKNKIISLVVK